MATIAPYGVYQAFDDNGDPLAGGQLFTYEAGTSTPKPTYTDYTNGVANTNPVILDASGMANVWLEDGGYKFVLKDSADVTIFTVDGIGGTDNTAFGANVNTITTNTIINSTYANSVNIVTGTTTLSLQPASTLGEGFYISVKNNGSGNVTIDPDGAETIDGAATKTLYPGDSALIISTGTAWFTLFLNASLNGNNTFSGDNTFTGKILTPSDGTLTIASGAVTVTGAYHLIDTESAASVDQLDTINGGTSGQILQFRQADSSRDIVVTNAGNITTPDGTNILLASTGDTLSLKYDGGLSKWLVQAAAIPNYLMQGLKDSVLNGFVLSNNGTDATNDIDITAGSCVSDDGTTVMTISSTYIKQTDVAWAVGTGQGGLDTGAVGNNTYYVWVINRPDTNVTDILFSLSSSSPTMPANYTKKKRIGAVFRSGGALLANAFNQNGVFTSARQTITAGGALTINHGLTVAPTSWQAFLVCTTANLNYSVNDVVPINPHQNGSTSNGQSIVADATSISVRYGSTADAYELLAKTTGTRTAITAGSWALVLRASIK